MPIRKLTRNRSRQGCGDPAAVSGGMADPLTDGGAQQGAGCGDPQMVSGGMAQSPGDGPDQSGGGAQGGGRDQGRGNSPEGRGGVQARRPQPLQPRKLGAGWQPPSLTRLESAATEIITALHEAKEALAQEMEANLKQLRAVLEETQRIARDMEAVLKEVRAEPNPEEMVRGRAEGNGQQHSLHRMRSGVPQQGRGWQPPAYLLQSQRGQELTPSGAGGRGNGGQEMGGPGGGRNLPPWQPPPEALEQGEPQQAP